MSTRYPGAADLQTEHERYLTEEIFKRPVFVTDYPKEIKAFYMKMNEDGKTVAAVDCLVPGIGEIIGGSQREDDYDKLSGAHERAGTSAKRIMSFYLDLQKVRFRTTCGIRTRIRALRDVSDRYVQHP